MAEEPIFFSIIIPTYNRPGLVRRALKSVYVQSFKNYEVLVINDGSNADYSSVEQEASHLEKLRYFYKENSGPSTTRNHGIDNAKGKFICFLDDDDEYLEDHLLVLHRLIEKNKYEKGLYKTLTYLKTGEEIKKQVFAGLPEGAKVIERVFANIFGTCNVCISAEIVEEYKFRAEIPVSEDFDLWARIALNHPLFESDEYTTIYNFHGSNTSLGDEEMSQKKHIIAFKQIFAIPGLKNELPIKYWSGILQRRYLWLSREQRRKKKIISAIASRAISLYYKLILNLGTKK